VTAVFLETSALLRVTQQIGSGVLIVPASSLFGGITFQPEVHPA